MGLVARALAVEASAKRNPEASHCGEALVAFEFEKEDAKGESGFHRKRANRRRFTYRMCRLGCEPGFGR
jgi:hypothetical protein